MKRTALTVTLLVFLSAFIVTAAIPSEASGTMWEIEQEVSTDLGAEWQLNPSIAVDSSGRVHIAWRDSPVLGYDIYYRYFNGTSWQPEQEISMDTGTEDQTWPSIAVNEDKVHIVWIDMGGGDNDLFYRYFNGTSWQPEQEISTDITNEFQWNPSVAVENDSVHVVWGDAADGDYDIYYRYFDGTGWQPEQEISTDILAEDQWKPSVAVHDSHVHVSWIDAGDGDFDIYYRHFNGTDWEPELEVSTDSLTETQTMSSLAVDNDTVHIVWIDAEDGDYDIYHRHFNGTSWQPEQEISTDMLSENQWNPSISAYDSQVCLAWQDDGGGDGDILLRFFDGTSWQPQQEVNTDAISEDQRSPSTAIAESRIHVVWEDYGDGDWDIYYRRGVEDLETPESWAEPVTPYWQTISIFDVGWTATDDYGLANISLWYKYSSDNSSWSIWDEWDYDGAVSGTFASGVFDFATPYGDGYYEFYTVAEDAMGNQEVALALADAIAGVDTSPPYTALSIGDPSFGTLPIYVSPTTEFTLIGADNLSGIESTWFGIDSEPMTVYSTPINLSGYDGPHLLKFLSVDNAGNNETVNEVLVHADDTPPTSAIQFGQPAVVCWPTPICISSSTQINISATDDAAGVESTWVQLDGDWFPYEGNFTIPTDGMHNIFYNSTDNVKNHERINTWGAFVDNTPPVADAGPDQDVPMGALVTFEGNQSFDLGGINNHTWSFFDAGNVTLYWRNPSHIFEVSGDFLVTLVVKDIMGYTDTDTMWVNVTAPPVTPKNLTVESGERGELKLTWDPVEDVVGYNLYRANISGGPYIQVNEEVITHLLFNDTGLPDATTFYYTVTAVDFLEEESPPSLEASGTIMAVGEDGMLGEYWWVLLLLGSIIFVLLVLFMRKRKLEGENPPDDELPSPEPQRSETDDA